VLSFNVVILQNRFPGI